MEKIAVSVVDLSTMVDEASRSRSGGCAATMTSFELTSGYFIFETHCSTSMNSWSQEIQIVDWQTLVPEDILAENPNWEEIKAKVPDILRSDARVHCNCPAFQYWGHGYNLTNIDTSLYPNAVPPTAVNERGELIRDPDERQSCKHLAAVYNTYFH